MRASYFVLGSWISLTVCGAAQAKAAPSPKAETRCGWVDNPTPSNWTLTDKDDSWLLQAQLGYEAKGEMPDFGDQWVKTNVNHGYGCACMRAVVDVAQRRVVSYEKVKVLPISRCKSDKKLSQKDR